jgi:hypothetical protein
MMRMNWKRFVWISIFLLMNAACLKPKNEWPPINDQFDPELELNCWLAKLNAIAPAEGAPILLDSNWTIAVQVSANDATGNFYNQLVVEDSTAGISIQLNVASLYTQFPVGRKLYLKLQGLYIGNYHGTYQIGAAPYRDQNGQLQVSAIPEKWMAQYIIPATLLPARQPYVTSLKTLQANGLQFVNRLIRIDDIELVHPNVDITYADALSSTSILLQDCTGGQIVLRTSNYARFQSSATPWGKASFTAVYTVYNGVGQLAIRDTSDVVLTGVRCDGSLQTAPTLVSIDSLRKIYAGKDTILGNLMIKGVVTSDVVHGNFGSGNIIIQDAQKGIIVYFGMSAFNLPFLGDSVTLNVSGSTLTQYAGALEIKNIKTAQLRVWASNIDVAPIKLSIATLNTNFKLYESVLVKIEGAKIMGSSSTFLGNKTLNDGTGNILLYTSSAASFATQLAPSITKTFQGIATPYNTTNEIKIRNPIVDIY